MLNKALSIFDKKLIRSVIHLGLSLAVSKLFLFIAIAFAARALGPVQWGIFSYAFTILFIMHLLGDFGFHTLIMRESAKGSLNSLQLLEIIWARFYLGLLSIGLAFIAIWLTHSDKLVLIPLGILSVSVLIRPVYASVRSFTQGIEQMHWTIVLDSSLYGIFLLVICLGTYIYSASPVVPAVAWLTGVMVSACVAVYVYRKSRPSLNQSSIKLSKIALTKMAAPFLMINVIVVVFHRADILMLEWFRGYEEVGYYSVAYQIFDVVALLPGIMVTVFFPRMVKHQAELRIALPKILLVVMGLSSIGSFIVFLLSNFIVTIIFGSSYSSASSVVPVLMIGIPFMAMTGVLAHALFVEHKAKLSAYATGVSLIVNIVLNYFFIPQYGMMAAGVTTAMTLALNSFLHTALFAKWH